MEQLNDFGDAENVDLTRADLKPSMQQVIELVRNRRNNKIKLFADKNIVVDFFLENYDVKLSDRKYEFLSRELAELLIAPVDLAHYAAVINDFKEQTRTTELDQECDRLVMQELVKIFNKYTF